MDKVSGSTTVKCLFLLFSLLMFFSFSFFFIPGSSVGNLVTF